MTRFTRSIVVLLLVAAAVAGCSREKGAAEDSFKFEVYPAARYLPQLTEVTKQAYRIIKPSEPDAPQTAIYDTDAQVADVAKYYAELYGYGSVAPDATNNLSAAKPRAFHRTGDLQADQKAIEPLLPKLNLKTDVSKAVGSYDAVEIAGKSNRPQVTIQRPYFDVTTSQVVNKTLILMSR
jgi:hypothetical protein